jgi:hypothetical protein
MRDVRGVFSTWHVVAAVSIVLGAGMCLYSLATGQAGGAIAMSGILLAGLTLAIGGHYLEKRVNFVRCVVTAIFELRRNPPTRDDRLIQKLKAFSPRTTDEVCLAAITRAKEFLWRPEYLTPEIRREIEMWERAD